MTELDPTTGIYETRPLLDSFDGFTMLEPPDKHDEIAIQTPGLILDVRSPIVFIDKQGDEQEKTSEPLEWINSMFPEKRPCSYEEQLRAFLDSVAWRYLCVCGQWEDDKHDQQICDERCRELTEASAWI